MYSDGSIGVVLGDGVIKDGGSVHSEIIGCCIIDGCIEGGGL